MIGNRILILGASGFIGNSLYKELLPYFDVYGTYCTQQGLYSDNKVFYRFNAEKDSIAELLEKLQPRFIISSFNAEFQAQLKVHKELAAYCNSHPLSQVLYLSSWHIFDGQKGLPAYENDTPVSDSIKGLRTIATERLLLQELPFQTTTLRLPLVLGVNSPTMVQLRSALKNGAPFEVYPNHIVSVTTNDKIAQQVHYIINQELTGVFHLASKDMIHHDDLFQEISSKLSDRSPTFKHVFDSNEDVYDAILPKVNKLPKVYRISVNDVIESSTLNEEISTFKQSI